LNQGIIAGEQLTPGAPWRIRLTEDLRARVAEEAPDDFLTMYQTMRLLGVSRQTVWQRVKRGEIKALHVRRGRKKGLRLLPSLSRATPSAVSEHFSELLGCPISRSLTTYCVRLELRSRPSSGITRLHRYNGPLRLPRAPSLSLTGVRLVIPDHALG